MSVSSPSSSDSVSDGAGLLWGSNIAFLAVWVAVVGWRLEGLMGHFSLDVCFMDLLDETTDSYGLVFPPWTGSPCLLPILVVGWLVVAVKMPLAMFRRGVATNLKSTRISVQMRVYEIILKTIWRSISCLTDCSFGRFPRLNCAWIKRSFHLASTH